MFLAVSTIISDSYNFKLQTSLQEVHIWEALGWGDGLLSRMQHWSGLSSGGETQVSPFVYFMIPLSLSLSLSRFGASSNCWIPCMFFKTISMGKCIELMQNIYQIGLYLILRIFLRMKGLLDKSQSHN